MKPRTDYFLSLVAAELERATTKHGPIASLHEGYAVILEEVDELWDEVRKQFDERSATKMLKELVQIAAMAARTAVDVEVIADPAQQKEGEK